MQAFIARQPILDADLTLYGYELLYRDSKDNYYPNKIDGTAATRTLISLMNTEFDIPKLTDGKLSFINFTEELFTSNFNLHLNPDNIIIEILENIVPTEPIVSTIKSLKEDGYRLALDDYTGQPSTFAEIADIIKVDFPTTTLTQKRQISDKYKDKVLLAEKIETREDFLLAKSLNFKLFQGYYFSRPILLSVDTVEIAMSSYQRLWNAVNQPSPSFDQLTKIISLDANLAYKIITRINSLYYYRGHTIESIQSALIRMGLIELKRWILLLLLRDCFGESVVISAKLALTRAIFCEQVALLLHQNSLQDDAYMTGLFSNFEADLHETWIEVLQSLYISNASKDALMGKPSLLLDILNVAKQYEYADWNSVLKFLFKYQIESSKLLSIYLNAVA